MPFICPQCGQEHLTQEEIDEQNVRGYEVTDSQAMTEPLPQESSDSKSIKKTKEKDKEKEKKKSTQKQK